MFYNILHDKYSLTEKNVNRHNIPHIKYIAVGRSYWYNEIFYFQDDYNDAILRHTS